MYPVVHDSLHDVVHALLAVKVLYQIRIGENMQGTRAHNNVFLA